MLSVDAFCSLTIVIKFRLGQCQKVGACDAPRLLTKRSILLLHVFFTAKISNLLPVNIC